MNDETSIRMNCNEDRIGFLYKMFPLYVRNGDSNNILGVFRPMYILARIAGLFPFSVNLDQSFVVNQPFVSKVDILILILHISVYAAYTFLNIYTNTHKYVQLSSVLDNGKTVVLVGGITSSIAVIIFDFLNRKNVWKIFRKLELFDREVKQVAALQQREDNLKMFNFTGSLSTNNSQLQSASEIR